VNKSSTRKLTSVLLASALLLGGSIAMSASANAAGKQGTACTKLKAKSGIYTCSKNPFAPTSTKLIWITGDCAAAQVAYKAEVSNMTSYIKDATNATNQAQSLLASYQNALTVAQTQLNDVLNTKVYTIDYDPVTNKPSNQVIGYNNALAAYQAKLDADKAGLATAQAALAKDTPGSQQAINDQATVNAYTTGVKYRQQTIDQLKKSVARIQSTITSDKNEIAQWASTAKGAVSQQKSLTAQLKSAVTSAKSTRALACKAGR
jgi:hypothetical protein